jgi:hypothetical protein
MKDKFQHNNPYMAGGGPQQVPIVCFEINDIKKLTCKNRDILCTAFVIHGKKNPCNIGYNV